MLHLKSRCTETYSKHFLLDLCRALCLVINVWVNDRGERSKWRVPPFLPFFRETLTDVFNLMCTLKEMVSGKHLGVWFALEIQYLS